MHKWNLIRSFRRGEVLCGFQIDLSPDNICSMPFTKQFCTEHCPEWWTHSNPSFKMMILWMELIRIKSSFAFKCEFIKSAKFGHESRVVIKMFVVNRWHFRGYIKWRKGIRVVFLFSIFFFLGQDQQQCDFPWNYLDCCQESNPPSNWTLLFCDQGSQCMWTERD